MIVIVQEKKVLRVLVGGCVGVVVVVLRVVISEVCIFKIS